MVAVGQILSGKLTFCWKPLPESLLPVDSSQMARPQTAGYHWIPGTPVEELRSDGPANSEGLVRQPGSSSGERTFANAVSFQVESGGFPTFHATMAMPGETTQAP